MTATATTLASPGTRKASSTSRRLLDWPKTQSYFSGSRNFADNTFGTDGNFGVSQFNLPAEVVYATGVRLVDVTKDVYNMSGNGASYLNQAGRMTASALSPPASSRSRYAILGPADGNTDGYDLDAIRVQGPDVFFGNRHLKPAVEIEKLTNGEDGHLHPDGRPDHLDLQGDQHRRDRPYRRGRH